ncbi:MAG: outer membrane protein transport protein [Pseudomonadota bacterium]
MKKLSGKIIAAAVSGGVVFAGASAAHAGAFALKERSAKAQGLSFAGATAGSGGLSSMGFNPGAIGLVTPGFNNGEISGGISLILPSSDGEVEVNGVRTGETFDAGRFGGVANNYVGYRLEDDILIGLSVFTPFGLATEYPEASSVAADAITSDLRTIQIAPTLGFEPIPGLTLGVSGQIIYADARLTSSAVALEGNQTNASFAVGALWDLGSTKLGLSYDHGYDLSLAGTATFAPGALNPAIPVALTLPVIANAELPATVSAGIVQEIGSSFRVMGELQWQSWSDFDRIDTNVDATSIGAGIIHSQDEQNYDDAFFVAVGAEYDVLDSLTVRGGAAFDQTPTSDGFLGGQINSVNATDRTARVPDEDRVWLSIGATYNMSEHMSIDAGYSYLFAINDSVVGLRNAAPGTQVVYEGSAHIFSIGGSLKF